MPVAGSLLFVWYFGAVRTTSCPLKQSQYARIYQASEHTVRTWMKKGAPLDNPKQMVESFLQAQRMVAPVHKQVESEEAQARYRQEVDRASEAAAVRAALGERLADLNGVLGLARDSARKHELANWRPFVERCRVISDEIKRLYTLAGINEDDETLEPVRVDLTRPVIWNWSEDREATSQANA